MLKNILNFSELGGDYLSLNKSLEVNNKVSVFKMSFSERILSSLNLPGKVLYVTADMISAKKAYDEFYKIIGDKAVLFSPGTDLLSYKEMFSPDNNINRMVVLSKILDGGVDVVVASIDSLIYLTSKKEDFISNIINIKIDKELDKDKTIQKLLMLGYKREELVQEPGTFAVRGGILDIFPINSTNPYRIELFDYLVESIKSFDPIKQATLEIVKSIKICSNSNICIEDVDSLIKKINAVKYEFVSKDEEVRHLAIVESIQEKLKRNQFSYSLDILFPFIKEDLGSIFDYLENKFIIVLDESKIVYDSMQKFYDGIEERKKLLKGYSGYFPTKASGYLSKAELIEKIKACRCVAHQKITSANRFFNPTKVFSFRSAPIIRYVNNKEEFAKDIFS